MHQYAKITKLVTLYYTRKKNTKLFYYQNKFLLVNSRLCLYIWDCDWSFIIFYSLLNYNFIKTNIHSRLIVDYNERNNVITKLSYLQYNTCALIHLNLIPL